MPTAGLHMSKQLMKRFEIKGIETAYLTLHIGLGTFREVEVEDLTKHKVDSEQLIIPEDCVATVNRSIEGGGKVCAVGTSVVRAMETTHSTFRQLKTYDGWTSRFIFPPYQFKLADALITNFHTPQSTLLMLTAAFGGYELVMEAYETAIKEKYRMHAYGDALLVI